MYVYTYIYIYIYIYIYVYIYTTLYHRVDTVCWSYDRYIFRANRSISIVLDSLPQRRDACHPRVRNMQPSNHKTTVAHTKHHSTEYAYIC